MTLQMLLKRGRETLRAAQIAEWELDAWYLLEYAAGCTRSAYLLDPQLEADSSQIQHYEELIQKRSLHIPLQHLTGSQEFMGLSFIVDENVLIPRQDTEILVEEVQKHMKSGMRILDMCTGSGCILLSILKLGQELTGTGVDLSGAALMVAERNKERLGAAGAEFIRSDLFTDVTGVYDRIVSNPPYIPSRVVDTLMPEVREHEPRMALDGTEDGLYFYRKIIEQSPAYLSPGGMLFFEIGYDQAEAVSGLMDRDFTRIQVVKDLAGLDRVVYGTLRS
ncbi:MAG: peptide chain release factor N(5)-glutamine methyltransferase [Clostridiales bacterium]|nr:peptide chain release factor N(5)-glutamine methyltransferase [Clostridiales bacterium]